MENMHTNVEAQDYTKISSSAMFSKIVDKISKMVCFTLIISKQYCVLIHGFSLPWNVDHALRGVLQWLDLVNCLKKEKDSSREKL